MMAFKQSANPEPLPSQPLPKPLNFTQLRIKLKSAVCYEKFTRVSDIRVLWPSSDKQGPAGPLGLLLATVPKYRSTKQTQTDAAAISPRPLPSCACNRYRC